MNPAPSRRQFLAGAAVALGGMLDLPLHAFADDAVAEGSSIAIIHTNDVHCAVGERGDDGSVAFGYSALASYVAARKAELGQDMVTLVDAGDHVQGNVMGSVTKGEALIDIMNDCGYDYAIPGNHEFDYGMGQFEALVAHAKAKYLSCNFKDLRSGVPTLRFDPYTIREYPVAGGGAVKIAFIGITTPATLTTSSPKSFWKSDTDRSRGYGFCEDATGEALIQAVQDAVDAARGAGAGYVIALAHLGQGGSVDIWRSDRIAGLTSGIDVIIDGHSHEEYVQTVQDRDGGSVIITQTGTKFSSVGQVLIDPATGTVRASTPHFEATLLREARKDGDPSYVHAATFGRDDTVQGDVDAKVAGVKAETGKVVGASQVELRALKDDGVTWAVRSAETNLGDFVADAYLYFAANAGVMADFAFTNGGGVRADIKPGNVTLGDLINVNPFNNQLCYASYTGQEILDALELSMSTLPNPSGAFLQVSEGFKFTVRTDIESPVIMEGNEYRGIDGSRERRVRNVTLYGKALDAQASYTLVCHSYYLEEGGNSFTMLKKDDVTYLGLDNAALAEYMQTYLHGTIGSEYANIAGNGRITMQDGPDPAPQPESGTNPDGGAGGNNTGNGNGTADTTAGRVDARQASGKLPDTGDASGTVAAALGTAAIVTAAVGTAAAIKGESR